MSSDQRAFAQNGPAKRRNEGPHFARKRSDGAGTSRIWQVNPDGEARRYTINRNHELIRFLKERLGQSSALLDGALDLIERTVPVERVWLDVTERVRPRSPRRTTPSSSPRPERSSTCCERPACRLKRRSGRSR
jgi:hypothetical protein